MTDDVTSLPSLSLPQTRDEAFRAMIIVVHHSLLSRTVRTSPLANEYTRDAGMGVRRSQQQVDWLNEARESLMGTLTELLTQELSRL